MEPRSTIFALICAAGIAFAGAAAAHAQESGKDDDAAAVARAQNDFLYFKDAQPAIRVDAAREARVAEALDQYILTGKSDLHYFRLGPNGLVLSNPLNGVFTPRAAKAEIGLALDPETFSLNRRDGLDAQDRGRISLGLFSRRSQERIGQSSFAYRPSAAGDLRQSYEMGVSMGYGGFSVDAAYAQVNDAFADVSRGVDLGLNYEGGSWRARLSATGMDATPYSAYQPDPLGLNKRFYALELGAAYDLRPGLLLSGGIRYAERLHLGDSSGRGDSIVFMGTAISF